MNTSPRQQANRVPPRIRHDERPLSQRGIKQPTLMDAPAKADIAFLDYHHKHPEVYAAFRTLALRLYERGVTHYGAKALFEVLRYETAIKAHGEPFKLNNSHVSRYARLLAANDLRFKDFFEFRVLRTQKDRAA